MPEPKEGKLYIPRTIELPAGFDIKVTQYMPMKMKEKHGAYCDAVWDIDSMTVDINRKLQHQRKWYVFSHEFAHAVNDWMLWLVNREIAKG